MEQQNKIKIRKNWGKVKPYERVITPDKVYDRSSFRRGLKEEIEEMENIKEDTP